MPFWETFAAKQRESGTVVPEADEAALSLGVHQVFNMYGY